MRKFWIMLLAAGLIMAFSVPAFAVGGANINVTGSYIVRGLYASNPSLKDDNLHGNHSFSVFDQRLRLQPEFKIAEGLVLVTRFDVLEKKWDGTRYGVAGTVTPGTSPFVEHQGDTNLSWERVYVDFTTGIGRFMVGYQNFTSWGTAIADGANSYPGIKYIFATGPLTIVAALEQNHEGQAEGISAAQDADATAYDLGFMYKWTGGEVGLLYQYVSNKATRPTAFGGFSSKLHIIDPYVKATFGPVYFEAEGIYLTGKAAEFDTGGPDKDASEIGIYAKINVDLKPAYVGAIFAWVQGDDDPLDNDVDSGWLAALSAGSVFEPCLIFGSYWYNHAGTGGQQGYASGWTYFWDNIWFGQVYGGIKPIPKLDIFASVSYMKADKKPTRAYVSKDIGWEIDVKATYKIFDNLEYTVGAGYLIADDYFKGTDKANKIEDNYLLLHQLTLSF